MSNGVRITDKTPVATIDQFVGIKKQGGTVFAPIEFEDVEQQLLAGAIGDEIFANNGRPLGRSQLCQKLMMICDTGPLGTPIFTGAEGSPQGGCVLEVDGVEYIFLLIRVSGTTWTTNETFRIVQYVLREDGLAGTHVAYSAELLLGHQPLSGYVVGSQVYLIAGMRPQGSYVGDNVGKGYSKITWRGASTAQADVTSVAVAGLVGSSHPLADFYKFSPFISNDGVYMHFWANDNKFGTTDDTAHSILTFEFADVEALNTAARPFFPIVTINGPAREDAYFLQGGASNNQLLAAARGYYPPFGFHGVQFFDLTGNEAGVIEYDGPRARYGRDLMLNHPTLGNPVQMENEGCDYRSDSEILVIEADSWKTGGDIVSDGGKNWCSIRDANVGNPPAYHPEYWVETTKATTLGAFNIATTYQSGTYTRRQKLIYSLRPPSGDAGEEALSAGITNMGSGGTVRLGDNAADITYPLGASVQAVARSEQTGEQHDGWGVYGGNGERLYDLRYGSDFGKYGGFSVDFSSGREIYQIRVNGALSNGAGANFYGKNDSGFPGWLRFWALPGSGSEIEVFAYDPISDRPRARKIPVVLASSAVAVSVTGTTTETTLATVTIPAGSIGPNGFLRIHSEWSAGASNANTKTTRIKFDGQTLVTTGQLTSNLGHGRNTFVKNRNSQSSQVTHGSAATADPGTTSVSPTTTTVNTALAKDITFTAQCANAGDTITLESYTIELCYMP